MKLWTWRTFLAGWLCGNVALLIGVAYGWSIGIASAVVLAAACGLMYVDGVIEGIAIQYRHVRNILGGTE